MPTDIKFTGQRLDATDLYYYGARFYDPNIGRFISPDTIVPDATNPQAFNRYSYVLNNPLKYIDPTGRYFQWSDEAMMEIWIDDNAPPVTELSPEELRAVANSGLWGQQPKPTEPPNPPPLPLVTNKPVVLAAPESAIPPATAVVGTMGTGFNINVGFGIGFSLEVLKVVDSEGNTSTAVTLSFGGATPNLSIGTQIQVTNAATINDLTAWSGGGGVSTALIPQPYPSGVEYFGRNRTKEGGYDGYNVAVGPQYQRVPLEVHGYVGYTWLFGKKRVR